MTEFNREEYERHCIEQIQGRCNQMKQTLNIIALANNEYHFSALNEEYERIATKYHNKEITYDEFLEEYELLKVAMKLIDT